jgi:N-acetylneuraminic acid mutarotase
LGIIFALVNFQNLATAQSWNSLTPLPDDYFYQSIAYFSNFVYQTGGDNGFSEDINVLYAQVQTNGTIGAWKSTTPLPEGVAFHAGVAANGFLYVIDGYHFTENGVYPTNIVYYAKINSDGTVGSWQTTSPLPQSLFYLGAAVWNNTIYVTGGSDGYQFYSNVYSAKIQVDGSLSAWVTQPSLPIAISAHSEVANGMLYVLGGLIDGGNAVDNEVYYSNINPDGSLAGWNQTTPLPQGNAYFGVAAASGRIFTIGGDNGLVALANCYNATVMGDGTLGAWSAGTSLPQPIFGEPIAVSSSYIFIAGGQNSSGGNVNTVYSMALPAPPPAPALTKSNFVNGTFNLRLTSTQTNTGFGLLASTNLVNWTNIGWGFTGTNGVLLLQDTNASNFPRRFYRAYWPLP